jgi:hypothetical protein
MKALIIIILISHTFYLCISNDTKKESDPAASTFNIDPYAMIREGQALLREGDLVVRLNQDPMSIYIKDFNRHDKSYSHAGLVMFENGYPYIYHLVNGSENPSELLRKDSLSRFCDPKKNSAFGIFRYELNESEIKNLKTLIKKWYKKQIRFDMKFSLASDDKMYCSEMISKGLAIATHKRILIASTKLTGVEARFFSGYMKLPFHYTQKLQIVSIDNLYINPSCHLIKQFKLNTSL